MDTSQFVTKKYLEKTLETYYHRTEKMVAKVVGEVVGDALQLIAERFDKVDRRFDRLEARMDRMEDKLDRVAAIVDLHTVEIRELKRKLA